MPLSISTPKTTLSSSSSFPSRLPSRPSLSSKLPLCPQALRPPHLPPPPSSSRRGIRRRTLVLCNSASSELSWLEKLPESNKPLYSHSLPCIEAWLKKLGFHQSKDDRALWSVENPGWHAQLSLDVTDLHIRYLKSGPGTLEKDVERKFSYALSRKDVENAILGGP
ncbi:hypothetical protein MRB53_030187 [Persea americana]|uniref:Uncharacterized protein n=1 Tax=Persea americana TaxID=3435 RepID=A0ACC2KL56_PERAE|nr:hypothetical protein MRB53_030187 [Persea americana]